MNTVIVTGANGFIGTWLCKALNEKGVKTYAVLRSEESYVDELKALEHCIPVFCDMEHVEGLKDLISETEIDVLYHLAWGGVSGANRGDYHLQLKNVEQTMDVIRVASQMNCKRFVGTGSTAEYDAYNACREDGLSPELVSLYGTTKITAHFMSKTLCKSLGMEHVWAYVGNTYGCENMGSNFISFAAKQILSQDDAKFTAGEQNYDFVHVSDIAEGLYCVGERGKDKYAYYVGSGHPRKLKEYVIALRDALNPTKELLLGAIPFHGRSAELSDFDVTKIHEDTGYEAKVSFEEGARRIAEYHKR